MNGAAPLRAALDAALRADPRVHLLGEALELRPATRGLRAQHPGRVHLLPMSDRLLVGVAIGMATAGARPIVELADGHALWGALAALGQEAAPRGPELRAPVIVRVPWGEEPLPLAALCAIPGLAVAAASCEEELPLLLEAALAHPGPTVLLERAALPSRGPLSALGLGAARLLREGDQLSLIAFGDSVEVAILAAEALGAEGVSAAVLDLRSLRPLDAAALQQTVLRTGRPLLVGAPRELLLDAALLGFVRLESPPATGPAALAPLLAAARESLSF